MTEIFNGYTAFTDLYGYCFFLRIISQFKFFKKNLGEQNEGGNLILIRKSLCFSPISNLSAFIAVIHYFNEYAVQNSNRLHRFEIFFSLYPILGPFPQLSFY